MCVLWLSRVGTSGGQRDVPIGSSDTAIPADSGGAATDSAVADSANPQERPVPGSMAAELLNTTAANRVQILTLAISDAGFECPPGASAKAAGNNGAVWRVHCGESNVYWVEVNEIGRLHVRPAPYSDFGGAGTPVIQDSPELRFEPQDRELELIEPR